MHTSLQGLRTAMMIIVFAAITLFIPYSFIAERATISRFREFHIAARDAQLCAVSIPHGAAPGTPIRHSSHARPDAPVHLRPLGRCYYPVVAFPSLLPSIPHGGPAR